MQGDSFPRRGNEPRNSPKNEVCGSNHDSSGYVGLRLFFVHLNIPVKWV